MARLTYLPSRQGCEARLSATNAGDLVVAAAGVDDSDPDVHGSAETPTTGCAISVASEPLSRR